MIPYGRQSIDQADIDAVIGVLTSDWLTQGPAVPRFERAIADYCGAAHAVSANSATGALHIACLALGVGPGDMVWTSPISFVASANCARYCGADVDFVDVDPATANMSVTALRAKLEQARAAGRLPKVVIPVHLSGQSCDMAGIRALAGDYGFKIIEDASHAVGGSYRDEKVGSCRFSDVVVFSFHPVKIITSAEGGMALTNDAAVATRMERLRSHGIIRDEALMANPSDGPWYYEQVDLGYNYRLTDVHAALGLSQLGRIDAFVARRHAIADRYDAALADLPLTVPVRTTDAHSSLHLYVIRLALDRLNTTRRAVFEALRAGGIGVNVHYIPIYRQPDFAQFGFDRNAFPQAERYYSEAISLPMYPTMTNEQQDQVIEVLRKALAS